MPNGYIFPIKLSGLASKTRPAAKSSWILLTARRDEMKTIKGLNEVAAISGPNNVTEAQYGGD